MTQRIRVTLAMAGLMMISVACGGDQQEVAESPSPAEPQSVSVRLANYVAEAEPASVAAGSVTFDVSNDGGFHDFVVLRTDLSAADLPEARQQLSPKVRGVKVDLEAPRIEAIDSIEVMEKGDRASLTVDLEPGHYVLFCDLVNVTPGKGSRPERVVSHYGRGMSTDFTVR